MQGQGGQRAGRSHFKSGSVASRACAGRLARPACVRGTAPPAPKAFDAEKYLTTLDPEQESLKATCLTAQTLREWKAGYKKGNLMAAIEGSEGIAGFMAISLEDQTTIFPRTWTQGSASSAATGFRWATCSCYAARSMSHGERTRHHELHRVPHGENQRRTALLSFQVP